MAKKPEFKILETVCVPYAEAHQMIVNTQKLTEEEQWVLASEEDTNKDTTKVFLCRKVKND